MKRNKLTSILRPGHRRATFFRYALAFSLVLCAVASALSSMHEHPRVAVFASDVPAGTRLTASEVEYKRLPKDAVPKNAHISLDQAINSYTIAAASAGEVVTPNRLLDPSNAHPLVSNATGKNFGDPLHLVPVKIAEPDIIPLLHHGDTVSVVSHFKDANGRVNIDRSAHVISRGGTVISTHSPEAISGKGASSTILIALPQHDALRVASASLSLPLTVVVTGERAQPQPVVE